MQNLQSDNKNDSKPLQLVPWWQIHFGEDEQLEVLKAIKARNISQGPVVEAFEKKLSRYLEIPYVVATTSGSISILMALMAINIGHDDEVIIPNRTWVSTANAPTILGAKVKLVDVENDRPIIDVTKFEEAITPRTKAVIPVHLNGRSADMKKIKEIANKHNIWVIEDTAQALGSMNRDGFLGTQSDIGCFSLSVAKIISTGQGGFVVTREKAIYEKLISIRNNGVGKTIDNIKWEQPGFNFRLTDILASIGIIQLKKLDEHIEKSKRNYARYYNAILELPLLKVISVDIESGEVPVYVEVLCEERERFVHFLKNKGIESRPFYPDLNWASYLNNEGSFPNSLIYGQQGVYLPCGPGQSLENIDYVISSLREYGQPALK
jgi:perosamine synthetase